MTDFSEKNILAIDTSTRNLKLAMRFGGDRLVKSEEVVEQSHGRIIFKRIDNLLQSSALNRNQIEAVVVSIGPGSFTGLRIGLAVAKGLAVGLSIPVVGVSLFELAAFRYRNTEEPITVLTPFRRDEFVSLTINQGRFDLGQAEVVRIEEIIRMKGENRMIGMGFDARVQFSQVGALPALETVEFDGADLLYVGVGKLEDEPLPHISTLEPLYLGKSQAEIRFEQRQAGS